MRELLREIGTRALPWIGAAALLGLTWLDSSARQAVIAQLSLHTFVAVACGVGGVALTLMQPGLRRGYGVVLVLLLSWGIVVGWGYLVHAERFVWLDAMIFGFGAVLAPVAISALWANRQLGRGWMFAQVASLSLLAAPLSNIGGLFLTILILREGP